MAEVDYNDKVEGLSVENEDELSEDSQTRVFNKSNVSLTEFPLLEQYTNLQILTLTNNLLTETSPKIFVDLPTLKWLDLRYNQLELLPDEGLADHQYLTSLLLGHNQLKMLPNALGCVKTLKGLNISDNPLQSPPNHIIEKGLKAIKRYLLRDETSEDDVIRGDHQDAQTMDKKSSATSGDSRQKSILQKNNQFSRQKPIANNSASSKLLATRKVRSYPQGPSREQEEDTLPSIDTIERKMMEERRAKKTQLMKMNQDATLQKVKDQESRQKWRSEAKVLQMRQARQRAAMDSMMLQQEADERVFKAPFDVQKDQLVVFSGTQLEQMRRTNDLRESPKPQSMTVEEKLAEEAYKKEMERVAVEKVKMQAEAVRSRKLEMKTNPSVFDTESIRRELQMAEELQREIAMRRRALSQNMAHFPNK